MEKLASNKSVSHEWSVEKVYVDIPLFFDHVFQAIDQATRSIKVEYFIFEKCERSEKLIQKLRSAAQRGVVVQLMLDGLGSTEWTLQDVRTLQSQGIQTRIYRPYPWIRKPKSFYSYLVLLRQFGKWFKYLNRRNHRKGVYIDDKMLFTGSPNISNKQWRETALYVEGPELHLALEIYEKTWSRAWNPDYQDKEYLIEDLGTLSLPASHKNFSKILRLNYYSFLRIYYFHDLLGKIAKSKKRIWITNAYFIPVGRLFRYLKRAKSRGVDIKIIVPYISDHLLVKAVSSLLVWRLARAGIEFYEYLPSILHAKTLIIDDLCMVGSSNFNFRSFRHDLEIDLILQKKESLEILQDQFQKDLSQSIAINAREPSLRLILLSFLGRIFRYFKRWM